MAETVATTTNVILDPSILPPGPERAAAMTEVYNARHNPATELQTEAPEGVPAKFWDKTTGQINTVALLASYKALETRQSATPPGTVAPVAPAAPAVPGQPDATSDTTPKPATALKVTDAPPAATTVPTAAEGDAIAATVTAAGLNPDTLQSEIMTTGKLSDASVAALKAAGVPEPLIAAHTSTVKELIRLQSEANTTAAVTYAGGDQALQGLLTWATTNLTDAEKVSVNKLLGSADWRIGLDSLKARSGASSRTVGEPALTSGTGAAPAGVQGYKSVTERSADMNKPQYRKDPAFRAQVLAKMAVSKYELDR